MQFSLYTQQIADFLVMNQLTTMSEKKLKKTEQSLKIVTVIGPRKAIHRSTCTHMKYDNKNANYI